MCCFVRIINADYFLNRLHTCTLHLSGRHILFYVTQSHQILQTMGNCPFHLKFVEKTNKINLVLFNFFPFCLKSGSGHLKVTVQK